MRSVALLLACGGCLVAKPEGKPQVWPPQLGGTVESVVAGDLDGNGSTDIVAVMSGPENAAGLYEIKGGDGLVFGSDPVESFSRFIPMSFERPIATYLDAGVAPRIYIASGNETIGVTQLANNLALLDTADSTVPAGGAPWLRIVDFPGGNPHVTVSNGSAIEHFEPDFATARPLPGPSGPTWMGAQLATSYAMGNEQVAVVATTTQIYKLVIPMMPPFTWGAPIRDGEPWLGQTTHDFNGDGREEIVGLDLMQHRVCVFDPGAEPIVQPSCRPLNSEFMGVDVQIIAGVNLSQNVGLDILVIQADGMETRYSIVDDVSFANGVLTSGPSMGLPPAGPPRGRSVLARPSPATPYSVLTFGTDGTVVCALGPC